MRRTKEEILGDLKSIERTHELRLYNIQVKIKKCEEELKKQEKEK